MLFDLQECKPHTACQRRESQGLLGWWPGYEHNFRTMEWSWHLTSMFFYNVGPTGPNSATRRRNCLKYECNSSGTQITLWVGKTNPVKVTCSTEGQTPIENFGYVICPDPERFCANEGKKYCPRNCMGKWSCSGHTCNCVLGWTGHACSQSVNDTFYGSVNYGK